MSTQDRFHALDAVRAFALLAGIVLHATMSFFIFIPAQDVSQSTTLGVAFYVIHMFRMSAFYLIAGFFAHMMFHRRGPRAFVKDRAKRILAPMVGGWLIFGVLAIVVTIWGITRTFAGQMPPPGAEGGFPPGFPLTHLWFLYYLCIFYALALVLRAVFAATIDRTRRVRGAIDAVIRVAVSSYAAPIMLAAPIAAVLYLNASWPVWFGIPTPDMGFTPKVPAMVGFGAAFVLGWLLHRQTELLGRWRAAWHVHLVIAVALTAACLSIVGIAPSLATATTVPGPAWSRLVYTACYTLAIWFWTFGIVGAGLRFCSAESPLRRYLADSSYWLYLAHLPLVFFLQVVFAKVPLHWTVKFPLILAIALTVLLVSYHYLVRPTFIGAFLNGRKYPRRKSTSAPTTPTSGPDKPRGRAATHVAELSNVTKRYGKTVAVDELSLGVKRGELLAVLGPNGAGKSTAISLWLGMLEPDEGSVHVLGRSPLEVESRRDVGIMLQEVNLTPELKGRELIDLTAAYYPNPLGVEEVIALTGTEALAGKRYGKMSAGQKRQVQFAAAICGRPKLLFLDEPTVGLDVEARKAMWQSIRRLLDHGTAIVLTTHYLEEAEALADRVAVLAKGRLIALGTVDEMRSLVARKRISCASTVAIDEIKLWPGVVEVSREAAALRITAFDAEDVVRRLLAADNGLKNLEVQQATLSEAFTEITKEAA